MIEILDIPAIRARVAPISIQRYHKMIEAGVLDEWNVELLNGVLVEKMSRSPLHVFMVDFLFKKLEAEFSESDLWVRQEAPIVIKNSELEPDISVVEGSSSNYKHVVPTDALFVVEVAITPITIDGSKASEYAKAGVSEYWIVCPEAEKTEVYRNPVDGEYIEKKIIAATNTIDSTAMAGFSFNLKNALDD